MAEIKRIFGNLPGIAIGTTFTNRRELHYAGIHRPLQAGISGSGSEGADSVVVSGGYEDDKDLGNEIIYTGHGGKDPNSGKQVSDQQLKAGNLALAKDCIDGLPVRVIRGAGGDLNYSPKFGYRYDGLFYVERYWHELGRSGFLIWRFHLVQDPAILTSPILIGEKPKSPPMPTQRNQLIVQRIIRNSAISQKIKELYNYTCQICGIRLNTSAGPYAEGAHIRPLGQPHNGPDTAENILCLCPNDHVRFDYGDIYISDDYQIVLYNGKLLGNLNRNPAHTIATNYLAYHRDHINRMKTV